MPKNLTDHFTLEELVFSQTAARESIDNSPDAEVLKNLKQLAALLEEVRIFLGEKSLIISSGYRSPQLNKRVGGAPDSLHKYGLAADFTVPSYGSPLQVARAISNSSIQYDQLIHEFGNWVHIQLPRPGDNIRRQNLSIFNSAEGYLNGIVGRPKQ